MTNFVLNDFLSHHYDQVKIMRQKANYELTFKKSDKFMTKTVEKIIIMTIATSHYYEL